MVKQLLAVLILTYITLGSQNAFANKSHKILIFSKTAAFRHKSIPEGITAISMLGKENGFVVDTTSDAATFSYKKLKEYNAILFLNTTGDVLNARQQNAFQKYIQSGGGFIGVHAASDCEFGWTWYGNLVGAYFSAHPKQQMATLKVVDDKHLSTNFLPKNWKRFDEWYNYKWVYEDLHILIEIDESSYDAGPAKMGTYHPMAWYHNYDGGRAFYTALGHTNESYQEPFFLKHLLGGIKYAMGESN
ncbi:ThuA domain-containing protein [Flavobacterium fluviatile]|uniref:ThuA domain-containing protein n=1 Tax=Flavobacterium fluviatile TaxID=1862387 RepID=UPI0013D6631C|nr:ThuA domain-containing protein [Flavobacterium fluviatile]